jgi:thioredoxin-related protein
MRSRLFIIVIGFCLAGVTARAQMGPLPAEKIMQDAFQQAVKEKKSVFLLFHASWCVWCRRMDSAMNDKSCKKFFDKNYVIVHLVVDEHGANKNLENPGANEFRAKYNGDLQGIPFWIIFDKYGNLIGDSQIRTAGAGLEARGVNMGCPVSADQVALFVKMLKSSSRLKAKQQAAIEKRFQQIGL